MANIFAERGSRRSLITVSITAFWSMLGVKASKVREKQSRSWYSYLRKFLSKNVKKRENESDLNQLPSIPGAAMTGMLTFIQGHPDPQLMESGIGGHDDAMRSKDD